ncbi:hypothetical protein WME94_52180 [Sorangium sp. So ce429]
MPLQDLLDICPPPASPLNPPSAQAWRELEASIGSALPADYEALLERYGSGGFGAYTDDGAFFDLLFVLSPSHPADRHGLNAIPLMKDLTETLGDIRRRFPELVPHPVWPEPRGLLYAGGTTTQHGIYWETAGAPSTWTIVVSDYGCDEWFEWPGDLTSFLAQVAQGKVPAWITAGATKFPLVFRSLTELDGARLA